MRNTSSFPEGSGRPRGQQPMSPLGDSQQELLELMYAFKRGEKSISQVEQQFQEWHSRHIGVPPSFLFAKHEKHRKQSAFGLPGGLRNLILRKPKKKTSVDGRVSGLTEELASFSLKLVLIEIDETYIPL